MDIASRTPEGDFHLCPVCGNLFVIEPTQPIADLTCPHCGSWILNGFDSQRDIVYGEYPGTLNWKHLEIQPQVLELIPREAARENRIVPILLDGESVVVLTDQLGLLDLEKLRFILELKLVVLQTDRDAINQALEMYYEPDTDGDSSQS